MDILDELHRNHPEGVFGWKKKIIALANENVPKLKWNIHFYYIVELTTHFKFGHITHLEWVVRGEPNT
jgi:hypothetical protein